MQRGIIIALAASSLLIGGATWSRLGNVTPAPGLIAVNPEQVPENYYEDLVASFTDTTDTQASSTPLTTSDLVGRQLIFEYVALAQSGQATPDNLTALAEKYVESIPTITVAEKLSLLDLTIVSNSLTSFQGYSSALEGIYRAYAAGLLGAYSGKIVTSGPDSATMPRVMSEVYAKTASKLRNLAVPGDLAKDHLELINIYLENAVAMRALADSETDPASSFAGLLAIKSNAAREQQIVSDIQEILNDNGV